MTESQEEDIIQIPSGAFFAGCVPAALGLLVAGKLVTLPSWLVALELFATILGLFIFGSMRYRIDKNALTYGVLLVIMATFWEPWWQGSALRARLASEGAPALWEFVHHHLLTLHGLEGLFHADTMLFILGLTFFVAVISQTRLLESVSSIILGGYDGRVVATVATLAAVVSLASGVLDGVSMIGLMIRTMVLILLLARTDRAGVLYAVMVSTVVTTVCGMWLAYGEPPNLIMKANLHPHLDDAFFLNYCLPAAVGSFVVVAWNIRKNVRSQRIILKNMDIVEQNRADVRFLQALRHGHVVDPVEMTLEHEAELGRRTRDVEGRVREGEDFGEALVRAEVPAEVRLRLLGLYVEEKLARPLDRYYQHIVRHGRENIEEAVRAIEHEFSDARAMRLRSQWIGVLSFIPFIGFLVAHALNHAVPLFLASFAGFAVALWAVFPHPRMRRLALSEARHEYAEYLFLFPLFLSITLLQKTGFFDQLSGLIHRGIETMGASHVAFIQYLGATFLSAILDNNVVADFAARALHDLPVDTLHFFAMAQIAGYALGGCWTHIGCAQSVVAFAFIHKEVDARFTPFEWIRRMTPCILQIGAFLTAYIYFRGWLLR